MCGRGSPDWQATIRCVRSVHSVPAEPTAGTAGPKVSETQQAGGTRRLLRIVGWMASAF